MAPRRITPSQLSLFSISPVIGAWWQELEARQLFDGRKPELSALDQQLRDDGHRHEEVLLDNRHATDRQEAVRGIKVKQTRLGRLLEELSTLPRRPPTRRGSGRIRVGHEER